MNLSRLHRLSTTLWRIEPHGPMRLPGLLVADEALLRDMDDKVYEHLCSIASLPGIVEAAYAMPDAH